MNTTPSSTRREFLGQVAAAGAAAGLLPAGEILAASKAAPRQFKIIAFSKPFASLGPKETADFVADIGWDGIELPVRAKATQIAPEKVEEDLPRFVEALKKNGKEVSIVTSDITAVNPLAEKVLRTCARLGIRKYRLGFWKYAKDKSIPDSVKEIGAVLKDLAAMNAQLGLQAGFQNHSGADYVGASLWDLWTMMKDLDPKHMGVCYDIGHSTLEGGLSWPVQARLMEPRYVAVFLKDFYWEKGAKGWAPRWCAFGEGSVQKSFLTNLKKSSFNGPLCQHHEYRELGEGAEMVKNMKKDLATLREWLAA